MPEPKEKNASGEQPKSLEMRIAELEDKLSKMQVTEEELKAYHKVASMMGAQAAAPQASPFVCQVCTIRPPIHIWPPIYIKPPIHIQQCFECQCGPGGGFAGGGQFGVLGG